MLKKRKRETYALRKHISMSAHKARRVINQIRGCSYEETVMILQFMPYRACSPILELVSSAAANASYSMGSNKTDLIISKAEVNEGTTVKKLKPRSRGRSYPIKRPTCHITIGVRDMSLDEYLEDDYRNRNYLTWLKKDRWKKQDHDIIYHNLDSRGGVWGKK
uniref:Large ribosomal subunit protein uL22c n=1 Tax=Diapensia purpurea TaxID=1501235 RepID=A0A411AUI3_9ERIC|nr:50S ribosomal protein L22 [Diapensia purpurea]